MSGIPADIPDVGSSGLKLSQNPAFDAVAAGLSTEDYFVWSRFDGSTTLRDLLAMTGFPLDRSVSIVQRLRQLGAILLPGEDPANPAPPATSPTGTTPPSTAPRRATTGSIVRPAPRPPSGSIPPPAQAEDVALDDPTADERTALAEPGDLSEGERTRILVMHRRLGSGDSHVLLGVERGTDRLELRRSYFRLSKDFHPDRYYRRDLGSFGARLSAIFEALAHAYAQLTEVRPHRAATEVPGRRAAQAQAQTPAEHAAELFDRGCALEVTGDAAGALRLFDAVIRVDAQARYLRRAAACAIAAGAAQVAEEYARKAAHLDPQDPSMQRLLAHAFRASGRLSDAEEVLLMAMQLKNENDVLARELRSDLAEVRRLIARAAAD
jgi:hypothetical protein